MGAQGDRIRKEGSSDIWHQDIRLIINSPGEETEAWCKFKREDNNMKWLWPLTLNMWASVRLMLGIICNNAALSQNSSIRSNKRKKENSRTEKPPANASHEIPSRRIIPGCGYMRPFSMTSVLFVWSSGGGYRVAAHGARKNGFFSYVAIGSWKPHVEAVRSTVRSESCTFWFLINTATLDREQTFQCGHASVPPLGSKIPSKRQPKLQPPNSSKRNQTEIPRWMQNEWNRNCNSMLSYRMRFIKMNASGIRSCCSCTATCAAALHCEACCIGPLGLRYRAAVGYSLFNTEVSRQGHPNQTAVAFYSVWVWTSARN